MVYKREIGLSNKALKRFYPWDITMVLQSQHVAFITLHDLEVVQIIGSHIRNIKHIVLITFDAHSEDNLFREKLNNLNCSLNIFKISCQDAHIDWKAM